MTTTEGRPRPPRPTEMKIVDQRVGPSKIDNRTCELVLTLAPSALEEKESIDPREPMDVRLREVNQRLALGATFDAAASSISLGAVWEQHIARTVEAIEAALRSVHDDRVETWERIYGSSA